MKKKKDTTCRRQVVSSTSLYLVRKNCCNSAPNGRAMDDRDRKKCAWTDISNGGIIKALTKIYDAKTDILKELVSGCYFDDVKSIIEAIMTQEYYCEKLLKLVKTLKMNTINLKIFGKK